LIALSLKPSYFVKNANGTSKVAFYLYTYDFLSRVSRPQLSPSTHIQKSSFSPARDNHYLTAWYYGASPLKKKIMIESVRNIIELKATAQQRERLVTISEKMLSCTFLVHILLQFRKWRVQTNKTYEYLLKNSIPSKGRV
jgi:hypothetical protein